MSGFVILVEFLLVSADSLKPFRALIDDNARQSRSLEPGCQRFDVLVPEGAIDRIVLYEIYDDHQAFLDHLASEHYKAFERESAALVESKSVSELALVYDGAPE
ncbi:MAG: antibiotic biosynthesis monooxygenase [Hyphomicrobiales bacterium]|nr:antibiotic biosynthesis monooxygenase [Hyphomicrobiales bacterium]